MSDRLIVRLSRSHDYDLYCLYLSIGKKEFHKITKACLSSYVEDKEYYPIQISVWKIPEVGNKADVITVNLSFNANMKTVTDFLETIGGGKRSLFIKTVIRFYYLPQMLKIYGKDPVPMIISIPELPKEKQMEKEPLVNQEKEHFSEQEIPVMSEDSKLELLKSKNEDIKKATEIPPDEEVDYFVEDDVINNLSNLFGNLVR